MENDFSRRVNNLIGKVRERSTVYPHLYFVKGEGGDPVALLTFLSFMVEDRMDVVESYPQFLGMLRDKVYAS